MTPTPSSQPPPRDAVPLPRLSDEAAAEIYLFIEHVFLLIESLYGHQIRRHFGELEHLTLTAPDFDSPLHDPPF